MSVPSSRFATTIDGLIVSGAIGLSSRRCSSESPASESGISACRATFAAASASTSGVGLPRARFSAFSNAGSITA